MFSARHAATAAIWLGTIGCAQAQPLTPAAEASAAGPMVAVVGLKEQSFVLYGSSGIVRSTGISSGLSTNPTPIGIFSILEKRKEHWSNLYDAEMPHMQRLTWSGIALHEGRVTGRPASHGCVRLPAAFAEDLFGITRVGMRVIIGYSKAEPVEINHEALFTPRTSREEAHAGMVRVATVGNIEMPTAALPLSTPALSGPSGLQGEALAFARKEARSEARAAAKIDDDMKKTHAALLAEVSRLSKARDAAERALKSADRQEAADRKALESASADSRERVAKTLIASSAKKAAAETRLREANAALASKRDANASALNQADAADANAKSAWEAYRRLMRIGEPVSVLVSAKTGMLYVRQAFDPIFEVPVIIADRGGAWLGTHVFTLMPSHSNTSPDASARWQGVSLPLLPSEPRTWHAADLPPSVLPETSAAKALDRITIPSEVRARIEATLVPGSSLIVTDEALSPETGKGTDFIVELNLPQPDGPVVREARRSERPVADASLRPQQVKAAAVKMAPPRPALVAAKPASSFDARKVFASDR